MTLFCENGTLSPTHLSEMSKCADENIAYLNNSRCGIQDKCSLSASDDQVYTHEIPFESFADPNILVTCWGGERPLNWSERFNYYSINMKMSHKRVRHEECMICRRRANLYNIHPTKIYSENSKDSCIACESCIAIHSFRSRAQSGGSSPKCPFCRTTYEEKDIIAKTKPMIVEGLRFGT